MVFPIYRKFLTFSALLCIEKKNGYRHSSANIAELNAILYNFFYNNLPFTTTLIP